MRVEIKEEIRVVSGSTKIKIYCMIKKIKAWFYTNEEEVFYGETLFKTKESAQQYYFSLLPDKKRSFYRKPLKVSLTLFSLGITCISFATVFSYMPSNF